MPGKTIATIYFYIISAASLALIVIGIFNAVNFLINSTQYDKYPLRYPQADCENSVYPYAKPITLDDVNGATRSAQDILDIKRQRQLCLNQQEEDRKQHKIDDLKNSITFTLVGLILFAIHFPLARKQSNS
ncbi:hypothetical protein A3C59_04555 [Candidatus Daviesbacteria bacterium RIFCSPHIGHO2_02_FULL_36_13]|uniref:DUF5671 domain-containing protein n=1 Tax=Candidatus Daviesbacteria bacterium RIFCSPHIGHO2_02_FULL_36_13 TaxID=1797768 RepID=A0A1F5JUK5_9BACT|nr:MAG: hypothetical protein A3C59_04555 [Candidatus Daviesbacteria bacterium RIFCSPHIGHO2_02_FULL_36_13]